MSNLKFRINNNGNSVSDYLKHYYELLAARKQMAKALRSLAPHGRNYQTCKNPGKAQKYDENMYLNAHKSLDTVDKIIQGVCDGIIEAQKKGQD